MPMLAAEEIWCQLFSEPGAGSDLAGLSTKAVADGDTWVVTGQKIWTSFAHVAQFGILLARTDPNAPKHKGISYFICPMDSPGITVRPIVDMTAMHTFNEVFLDEVRIPAENLVGEVNRGWELAKVTLGNERVSLSGEGSLWGGGPTANHLINAVKSVGGTNDPILRQQLAEAYIESEILRILRLRTVTAIISGRSPGAEASVRKALADDHGKRLMNLAKNMAQASGMLAGTGPLGANPAKKPVWGKVEKAPFEPPSSPNESRGDETSGANAGQEIMWSFGFLVSPALTIGGGTSEVQRNIVAERSLGLPHEIDPSDTK
jgi:alkylation response protein AidB-like acyl-CoA dehydrogenase